jgi:hypothetical protein
MTRLKKTQNKESVFNPEETDDESLPLKGPIISYGADYTLDSIRQYNETKQIIVQPSFQRKFVWDIKKASKLIESLLLGYPVPNILLGRDPESEVMEVIDGQQRLLTICDYFKGRFRDERIFKLTGDKDDEGIDKRFINKTFDDLDESYQKKLKNAVLKAIILVYPKEDPNIKFAAFQRINTGSVVLNQQEIRNCIYGGTFNDLLFEINENNATWRKIISKKSDKRMKDVETILRFFAAFFEGHNYDKPITSFLNKFMSDNKKIEEQKIKFYKNLFDDTIKIIDHNIGSAFPRTKDSKTFNRAIFESVMSAVAYLQNKKKLNEKNLKSNYDTLINDSDYINSITAQTSDKKNYKKRLEVAKKILSK